MLEFILITALVLSLLYLFAGRILRFLAKFLLKKAQEQASKQYQQQHAPRPEGEVRIKQAQAKNERTFNFDKVGEYVDFEEVKEK